MYNNNMANNKANKNGVKTVTITVEEYEKLLAAYEREKEIVENISKRILEHNIEAYKVLAK